MKSKIEAIKFLHRTRNWGDYLSPYIFQKLSGRRAKRIPMLRASREEHFLTVGSVLRMADENSIVWGSGFIDHSDGLGMLHWGPAKNEVLARPRRIHAVRGKLTRKKLIDFGVDCPEVYGDPALLMPKLYYPKDRQKRYELGVIPHYTDLETGFIERLRRDPRVKVISMLRSRFEQVFERPQTYERVVDEALECHRIVSGSLHGLILADAYGIPSNWIRVNGKNVGDGFKYLDYFSSVGRTETAPMEVDDRTTAGDVLERFVTPTVNVETDALIAACPFLEAKSLR